MARQYIRVYDLTIIPPNGKAKIVSGLRCNFEITKSVLSFPNLAKITLYNPNPDTVSKIKERYTKIVFNAGYQGNKRLLFKGEIRNAMARKYGVDRTVTIFSGDGERAFQNARFNKTFSENVGIRSVIEDILKSFDDIGLGTLEGLPTGKDKIRGQTISGSSKDLLDQYAEEYGFNWNIQNGAIVTTPIAAPLTNTKAILINAATGMLGSPTVTEIGADVTTLLNPDLIPNAAFKIESVSSEIQLGNLFFRAPLPRTDATGIYKAQEVLFKGDTNRGDWTSAVKGRFISG